MAHETDLARLKTSRTATYLSECVQAPDLLRAKEAAKFADACGVAQLAQCFGLDLANALAGDLELFTYFFQRAASAIGEAEALL